jgi:hypothetical protein
MQRPRKVLGTLGVYQMAKWTRLPEVRVYLPLYLSEISYRFNHRTDHKLFLSVLRNALLTDKQLA